MLDRAAEAAEMARGHRREDLDRDRQLNLSLVRLLEIAGEAAARDGWAGGRRGEEELRTCWDGAGEGGMETNAVLATVTAGFE